jgi:hypothetical protein
MSTSGEELYDAARKGDVRRVQEIIARNNHQGSAGLAAVLNWKHPAVSFK